jgi:hypothetical protein
MTAKFEQRDPATMLWFLNRACESKVSYPSAGNALHAQFKMVTKARASAAKHIAGCTPYRCQFCGEFHLGHDKRRKASQAGR